MNYKNLSSIAICVMCAAVAACSTAPSVKPAEPINYGTAGVGPISEIQTRGLLNCYMAGDSATKIVELRGQGKSDEEIVKYYSAAMGNGWIRLIQDLLPIIAKDNPQASHRIDYGRSVYRRCVSGQFEPKEARIAEYCFQQNQFLQLAYSFRNINEPMEMAYTKMNAQGEARVITDALLARAKAVGKADENSFRIETYYGCLGHPEKAPNLHG
jgi:hypothetical protein